jgi:F-type H+-transporting ATPase subunit a
MQKSLNFKGIVFLLNIFLATNVVLAQDHHDASHAPEAAVEEKFNAGEMIIHHLKDAHGWHFFDTRDAEGHLHAVSLPLPIILFTDNGLTTFMSSAFHHDDDAKHVVEANGQRFVHHHGKIYYASEEANEHGQYIDLDEAHHASNARPLDFSITKNVANLLISFIICLWIFLSAAKFYKSEHQKAPRGLAGFIEPIVIFVRDDVARTNIGDKHYLKFVPYLLTLFFFIWINNMLGLFPAGANLTGNIAFTGILAVFTMIIVNVSARKYYWKHIFTPPVPWPLYPIMVPIEIIGIFTKPFALMVRLFANMTAGHIVILGLISMIFIFQSFVVAPVSILMTLFIYLIKVMVALLQAYIFALLTALFIGQAVEEHAHEEHH